VHSRYEFWRTWEATDEDLAAGDWQAYARVGGYWHDDHRPIPDGVARRVLKSLHWLFGGPPLREYR
jgi:hypothetical protein